MVFFLVSGEESVRYLSSLLPADTPVPLPAALHPQSRLGSAPLWGIWAAQGPVSVSEVTVPGSSRSGICTHRLRHTHGISFFLQKTRVCFDGGVRL